ncbi:MAG: hypothetical protein MUP81_06395 [Dehalococcoidia bacterium]|nr:hypothetical protein [Dehalococcoidia bacterium]
MQKTKVIDQCEWPNGCHRKAKFTIWRNDGKLRLCSTHDSYVGKQNLVACGCSQEEAIQINREVKREQKAISRLETGLV